jgi:hypothetical protein
VANVILSRLRPDVEGAKRVERLQVMTMVEVVLKMGLEGWWGWGSVPVIVSVFPANHYSNVSRNYLNLKVVHVCGY